LITVDRELCMGSDVCSAFASATFVHDNETKAVVRDPACDVVADIQSAAENRPVGAIELSGYEGA
jgi:ferredoxin